MNLAKWINTIVIQANLLKKDLNADQEMLIEWNINSNKAIKM